MNRRNWLAAAGSLAVAACGGAAVPGEYSVRVVRIHSKKFDFVPSEMFLKKDEPVVLEFTAEDIIMGFRCSALELESDMIPGKVLRVAFTPRQVGRFAFHCNVFCGEGHDDMDGSIVVTG